MHDRTLALGPAWIAACSLAAASIPAQTFAVELTPNADNTIYDSMPPTDGPVVSFLSNGAGTRCFAGRDFNGGTKRALLRFDVANSQIPPGSLIQSAELELSVQATQNGGTLAIHALTADWGEGGSIAPSGQGVGATSLVDDANWWDRFFGSMPLLQWATPGGDFLASPSATAVVGGTVPSKVTIPSTFVLAADAQAWLDAPVANFGWILLGDESAIGTAIAFATREDPANAPRLRITYAPPPNGAATTEFGDGCDPFAVKPRLQALGRPLIGGSFSIRSTPGGSGAAISALSVSLGAAPAPLRVDAFVTAGRDCLFHIDLGQTIFFGPAPMTLGVPLPTSTMSGLDLYWQGFGIEPANQSVVVTNALLTRTGSI